MDDTTDIITGAIIIDITTTAATIATEGGSSSLAALDITAIGKRWRLRRADQADKTINRIDEANGLGATARKV